MADLAPAWTPYRYGFNNPILYTDPLGLFETRAEAKEHRKKEGIEGRIRKQDDGSFAIVHKGSGGNIKTFNVTEFGVMTEFTYVERGVHLRDIGLDGFNDLSNPYSESYNPNAVVFTDGADIAYALGAYLALASPSARVVTTSKSATTVATQATNTGGRLGNAATRGQIDNIATTLESRGYTITGGGQRGLAEEYLRPLTGGRKGGSYIDITADHPIYGRLRINTVDVLKDGITPTARELQNATRIRQQIGQGEHLLLIPKK